MEELLQNIWIQGGAAGLLVASGWIMWWFERKERLHIRAERDLMIERFLTFMNDYKDLLKDISEGLAIQKLLEEEFARLRKGQ